jgi:hypothetical protein
MNRRIVISFALLAAGALAGCGSDTSCAASSADWTPTSNNCTGLQANQAFIVQVTICPLDCQSSPACQVDVQSGTIELDPIVHTCDQNSCGLPSCPAKPIVNCQVPGLPNGDYHLLVGSQDGGTVTVGGSQTSCAI